MPLLYRTGSGPKAMPPAMPRRFQGCQCAVKPSLDLLKAAGGTPTLSGRTDASAACHFEKMNALNTKCGFVGMLRLVLSVFLVLMLANPWQFAPPSDAHEAYVITELGNIFPVETKPVGGSGSATKSIAYNLMLQGAVMETIDFNGMILHGDAPTEAEREDLNEWVIIDPATKHAGAILDGTGITVAVPRFYSTYSYAGNSITELSHNPPADLINIQGHKTVYGSVSETGVQSGMTFSGTGWSIAKLGPVAGGSYRIQADVPSGSSVQFITSPNNMLRTHYDGSRYVLMDGGRLYAEEKNPTRPSGQSWGYSSVERHKWPVRTSWFSGDSSYSCSWSGNFGSSSRVCYGPDIDTSDLIRKIIWKGTHRYYYYGHMEYTPDYYESKLQSGLPIYVKQTPEISFVPSWRFPNQHFSHIDDWGSDWHRVNNNKVVVINDFTRTVRAGTLANPLGTTETVYGADATPMVEYRSSGGYNKITKIHVENSYYGCGRYTGCDHIGNSPWHRNMINNYQVNVVGSVTIKDRQPYDAHQLYTSDFAIDQHNPSNAYILVKPGGNTVTVKGVSSSPTSGIVFGLSGAPADTYYSLTASGTTIYGKTTPSGGIVLREADITIADYNVPGAITFYPNALKHADYNFGMVGFDLVNDATFRFGNSPLIHVPEEFVKVGAWADVYVSDVTLASSSDSVTLHYLSGSYKAGDTITVPYVKLYDDFRMTIDGQVTLPMNFTDVPRVI